MRIFSNFKKTTQAMIVVAKFKEKASKVVTNYVLSGVNSCLNVLLFLFVEFIYGN